MNHPINRSHVMIHHHPRRFSFILTGLFLLAMAGLSAVAADSLRESVKLTSGWRFIPNDWPDALRADSSTWEGVELPHTWNAVDGVNGGLDANHRGYRRAPAWYALQLPALDLAHGRRVYLKFNGASVVADVYLNGGHLGQHRGAFGAFAFEITNRLNRTGADELRVRVDNGWVADVAPLAGDFTLFGGIYRPVELIVTPPVCINPLDHASPGVALIQKSVTRDRAEIEVRVAVSRPASGAQYATLRASLLDAAGKLVLREDRAVTWAGEAGTAQIPLVVDVPHLWNGVKDPYLYSVASELMVNGRVVDRVIQPLGLRFCRVDPQLGFFLNGAPYLLRGVGCHQDRAGKGWAVSEADERDDLAIIREMGANAVRLAHYPHSATFLDGCDRAGLLVWAEIPLVNKVRNTPEFYANAEQQLVELIRQQRNHPAVVMWGLFNELYHQGPSDPCEDLVARLQAVAKREDPTRLTTAASNQRDRKQINGTPDLIACNTYPGWYDDGGPGMSSSVTSWLDATDHRGLGVSEYGAGASIFQHEDWPPAKPNPTGAWHPEEYQALCHEQQYRQLLQYTAVWGAFVWNAFDFASADRTEGDRHGINDKGLVTYDRQTRKDAFYFYKANWNPDPMVHLTSRRFAQRKNGRNLAIHAYSNCDRVELWINGESKGQIPPDDLKVAVWTAVDLSPGPNRVELLGFCGDLAVTDGCVWTVDHSE